MMFLCSRATRVAHLRASLLRLCSSVVPVSDSSCRLWNRKQESESRHRPGATSVDTMIFSYRVTSYCIYQLGIAFRTKQERFHTTNSLPYELCDGTMLWKANYENKSKFKRSHNSLSGKPGGHWIPDTVLLQWKTFTMAKMEILLYPYTVSKRWRITNQGSHLISKINVHYRKQRWKVKCDPIGHLGSFVVIWDQIQVFYNSTGISVKKKLSTRQ